MVGARVEFGWLVVELISHIYIILVFTNVLLIICRFNDIFVVVVFLESQFRSFLVVKYSVMHIRSFLLTRMHVNDGCCQYRSLDSFY